MTSLFWAIKVAWKLKFPELPRRAPQRQHTPHSRPCPVDLTKLTLLADILKRPASHVMARPGSGVTLDEGLCTRLDCKPRGRTTDSLAARSAFPGKDAAGMDVGALKQEPGWGHRAGLQAGLSHHPEANPPGRSLAHWFPSSKVSLLFLFCRPCWVAELAVLTARGRAGERYFPLEDRVGSPNFEGFVFGWRPRGSWAASSESLIAWPWTDRRAGHVCVTLTGASTRAASQEKCSDVRVWGSHSGSQMNYFEFHAN